MSKIKQRREDGAPIIAAREWIANLEGKFTRKDMVLAGIVCASSEAGRLIDTLKSEGVVILSEKTPRGTVIYEVIKNKASTSWGGLFKSINQSRRYT
ncbi:MAG: hypothetical protein ACRCUH_13725 [Shewanella sp.]